MQKKKSPAGKVFLLSGILTVAIIICGITLFTIGAGTRVNVESKPPANGSIVESGYKNDSSHDAWYDPYLRFRHGLDSAFTRYRSYGKSKCSNGCS